MPNEYSLMTKEEFAKVNSEYAIGKYEDTFLPILVCKRDGVYSEVGQGGSEPEDQNLWRDFNWVIEALQTAYNQGNIDGIQEGKECCGFGD